MGSIAPPTQFATFCFAPLFAEVFINFFISSFSCLFQFVEIFVQISLIFSQKFFFCSSFHSFIFFSISYSRCQRCRQTFFL
jgi:hypothetical protein